MPIQIRRDSWENDRQFDELQQVANAIERLETTVIILETLTSVQKVAIPNPGRRLIFDSTLGKLCFHDGIAWRTVTSV